MGVCSGEVSINKNVCNHNYHNKTKFTDFMRSDELLIYNSFPFYKKNAFVIYLRDYYMNKKDKK